MPVDIIELIKLTGGILMLIIPGYLWTKLILKTLTLLERLLVGFLLTISILTLSVFIVHSLTKLIINQFLILILFIIYTLPIIIITIMQLRKTSFTKISVHHLFSKKNILLYLILFFSFIITFLPHIINLYFLPFHVDEWISYSYTSSIISSGSTVFPDPYTGTGAIASPEIGFHITTTVLHWLTTTNLATIIVFMPAILGVLLSLAAFALGEHSTYNHGLESALLISFIPTTIRFLGPSFYVASSLGLLFLLVIILLLIKNNTRALLCAAFIMLCLFIIHPVTALAGYIIIFFYIVFLLVEKNIKTAGITAGLFFSPVLLLYLISTQWSFMFTDVIEALLGKQDVLLHSRIWPDFNHLGIITWALFIIGIYLCFRKDNSLYRTLSLSAIVFILIIGVYDRFGYGLAIIYDRSFLYFFLIVALIGGYGFSELRKTIQYILTKKNILKKYTQHHGTIMSILIGSLIILTALPAHVSIPYYELINENDYESFIWLRDNIEGYRDANQTYTTAAVDPYYASPFNAITGIHIICSRMNRVYNYNLYPEMEQFLATNCRNTSFLDRYQLSVIYGDAENSNLTKIYDQVYLYPGLQTR